MRDSWSWYDPCWHYYWRLLPDDTSAILMRHLRTLHPASRAAMLTRRFVEEARLTLEASDAAR